MWQIFRCTKHFSHKSEGKLPTIITVLFQSLDEDDGGGGNPGYDGGGGNPGDDGGGGDPGDDGGGGDGGSIGDESTRDIAVQVDLPSTDAEAQVNISVSTYSFSKNNY